MLRRSILATMGLACCISGTVAKESLSLNCIPQGPTGGESPIRRIELNLQKDRFSVVHIAENGERIDRASQYSIRVKPDSSTPAWEGANKRRRYLTMVGKVVELPDNAYEYIEQLFDARDGGAKIHETRAKCLAEGQEPKPAPVTAEAREKAPAHSACPAVADAHERLDCYDRLYPPAQKPAVDVDVAKAAAPQSAAPANDITEADLDAMRSTYEKNQARFVRDYGGKTFQASVQVETITRAKDARNRFVLSLERGISCATEDPKVVAFITNLNKGDRVRVKGVVDDIANGKVELAKCELSAASQAPSP